MAKIKRHRSLDSLILHLWPRILDSGLLGDGDMENGAEEGIGIDKERRKEGRKAGWKEGKEGGRITLK